MTSASVQAAYDRSPQRNALYGTELNTVNVTVKTVLAQLPPMLSRPPKYGCSFFGMRTLPFAC